MGSQGTATERGLDGVRVLVVGSSSGLGRSIGTGVARQGARVAFAARRVERVREAAAEAGGGAVGIACDVRDPIDCERVVADAVAALGGIDALVWCAGVGPLVPLADTDATVWQRVLETNLVGASLVTRACLPHLRDSGGRAVYLSSVSASVTAPWPGLGAYAVSKAALDKLTEAWSAEHPDVGFTRLVMGDSAGGAGPEATGFADGWDRELAGEYLTRWFESGNVTGHLVPVEEIVAVVASLLRSRAHLPSIVVQPRSAAPRPTARAVPEEPLGTTHDGPIVPEED